jgi:polyphosphate kinase
MERNLDRRVETAFPIQGKKLQQRVRSALDLYLADNTSALILQTDGQYVRAPFAEVDTPRNVQGQLLEKLCNVGTPVAQ